MSGLPGDKNDPRESAMRLMGTRRRRSGLHSMQHVYGRVKFWGVVQEHEGGYRAQYGYPASISDHALAHAYGVESEPSLYGNAFGSEDG